MIQINLFNSSESQYRLPLVKAALKEFSNIKSENKQKVHLVVYFHEKNEEVWNELLYPVIEAGIDVSVAAMPADTYMDKVTIATQSEYPYLCKWDDDVFINRYVWDFMIENVSVVDRPDVSVLAPTLSNGMPSLGLFIEDFLNEAETSKVHEIFLKDNVVPDIWGCNHHAVYNAVKNMDHWDDRKYWKLVDTNNPIKNTNHPWHMFLAKGLHPGRFSYDYNMFLAKHAENNIEKLLEPNDYFLDTYKAPYFCNNLFISTTEFFRESQKLFFNHWDEGQMTAYMNLLDQVPMFVRNCYGIQPAYGCTVNQKEIENYYISNIFEKL
jgi:hypothetical protein